MCRAVCVPLAFISDQVDLHKQEVKTKTAVKHLPEHEGMPNERTWPLGKYWENYWLQAFKEICSIIS